MRSTSAVCCFPGRVLSLSSGLASGSRQPAALRYSPACVLCILVGMANLVMAQGVQGPSLEAAAQEWLGRAESGDLIPAWNVKEPPKGIPQAFLVGPPIIKEARTRCRFHSEKERRALLLCLDIFGARNREDTPRAQLRLSPPPSMPSRPVQPPVAQVQVRGLGT